MKSTRIRLVAGSVLAGVSALTSLSLLPAQALAVTGGLPAGNFRADGLPPGNERVDAIGTVSPLSINPTPDRPH